VETFTLSGTVDLTDASGVLQDSTGQTCRGAGGYSDMQPGTAVTVQNATGATIGTGALATGVPHFTHRDAIPVAGIPAMDVLSACEFAFEVPDVPDGLPTYVVSVSARGRQVVDASQVHAVLTLTLGS
jgi:hypothetical protein